MLSCFLFHGRGKIQNVIAIDNSCLYVIDSPRLGSCSCAGCHDRGSVAYRLLLQFFRFVRSHPSPPSLMFNGQTPMFLSLAYTFLYSCAFSALPDEVCGTSHVSQNFASFAAKLSDPVKATYPSGRTRTIEGEAPKYFSNPCCPGMAVI